LHNGQIVFTLTHLNKHSVWKICLPLQLNSEISFPCTKSSKQIPHLCALMWCGLFKSTFLLFLSTNLVTPGNLCACLMCSSSGFNPIAQIKKQQQHIKPQQQQHKIRGISLIQIIIIEQVYINPYYSGDIDANKLTLGVQQVPIPRKAHGKERIRRHQSNCSIELIFYRLMRAYAKKLQTMTIPYIAKLPMRNTTHTFSSF